MTIDELNRKLNKSDWAIHAEFIHGNTFFYGIGDDKKILKLDRNNTISLFKTTLNNFGFFKIISDYVDTPVNERKSEKKYNIIFFTDDQMCIYYLKGRVRDWYIANSDNPSFLKNNDAVFTKAEINDIIECKPKYEAVIKAAMVEVEG
ncbi:hypothetical protein DY125_07835 [Apilactobacillus micheneri]|uniref:hypothetical protein n=1 Tax=Apilactobacillus micheneri TaxID=1899430 RepID=UPI00112DB4D3|nr:hypothetical protein [Apilactobacillus micheneri]TPR46993.1 hypothetical protein DY125_07835 [Apilactobacillus micheneri]